MHCDTILVYVWQSINITYKNKNIIFCQSENSLKLIRVFPNSFPSVYFKENQKHELYPWLYLVLSRIVYLQILEGLDKQFFERKIVTIFAYYYMFWVLKIIVSLRRLF